MSKENAFKLSRRKALASLGAVGVASAGTGLGTSAYFSDTESFENNTITAGELDLKVDWTEHYSDWSDDEAEGIDVSMEPGGEYDIGFPAAAPEAEQSAFVKNMADARAFLANTAIEAFPDVLDRENEYDARQATPDDDSEICDLPADLDGGDGVLSHPFRTRGTFGGDPNPQTTEAGDPLVNISDVKPGDFGEVTFGFHICGNPGYVWMTGDLVDASENGLTEPEMEDGDEDQTLDSAGEVTPEGGTVELLDEIQAALWYDTGEDGEYGADISDKELGEGDNYNQDGESFIPATGSLRNVLEQLESGMLPLDYMPTNGGAGGAESGSTSFETCSTTGDAEHILNSIDDLGVAGPRNVPCTELDDLLIDNDFVEDGTEYVGTKFDVSEAGDLPTGSYTTMRGIITIESVNVSEGTVTLSTDFPVEAVSIKGGNRGEREYIFETQGGTNTSDGQEESGCALDAITFRTPVNTNGKRAGLSNVEICYDPDTPTNGGDGDISPAENERECFPNSTTAYVGFEWWLPADVGNEVQGDSVTFDLGFYTEQCRHNDGSGQT